MICVLYRACLILAQQSKLPNTYQVFTVIPLLYANIEAADNCRGLQCHTAQFTWKLLYVIDRRQQELLVSACSETEETCWKDYLRIRITREATEHAEGRENTECFSLINPHIKSTGPAFGPFTNFSRRLSIQRAVTLGQKSNLQQVIIKNTETPKYTNSSTTSFSVVRSQSHMSSGNIPTLAPRRQDRIKLEIAISDIWTKSALPYPGMNNRRIENPIRASANHVMRKLSIASMTSMNSIASTFSKRSVSHHTAAVANTTPPSWQTPSTPVVDDGYTSSSEQSIATTRPKTVTEKRKPVVDFHNTPKAFLPEDFGLDIQPRQRARKLSARLSMMIETENSEDSVLSRPSRPHTAASHKSSKENVTVQQPPLPKVETVEVLPPSPCFGSDGAGEAETENEKLMDKDLKKKAKAHRSEVKSSSPGEPISHNRLARARKAILHLFV
jgi:hypothetical protein